MDDWSGSRKYRAIRRIRHSRKWLRRLRHRAEHCYPSPEPWSRQLGTWAEVYRWRRLYVQEHRCARKRCSDYMCGNPRKHFGAMTAQEARAADDASNQCEEAGFSCSATRFKRSW